MNRTATALGMVFLLAAARSVAAQGLSLRAAVEEALSRNPAVAAADARQQTAKAEERAAHSARLPRVDLSESATRSNNPVFVFGSLLEQGRFAPRHFDPAFLNAPDALTNYRAALAARFTIFDGFRSTLAVERGRNGVDRAAIEREDVRQRLRAETIARFYGVLLAAEKVKVAKEAVATAEAGAKSTRDRFEQGLLVESDALSTEVQLAGFRQRLIAAEGELAIARAALATLLQRPYGETIAIDGALAIPSGQAVEAPLDAAIALALRQRAPVRIASLAAADARLNLTLERATALPRVDAYGTFGASGSTPGRRNSDATGAVAISLELFDRTRDSRIAAARAGIDAARAGDAQARDAVTMEVIAAWHRLQTARESAAVATAAVGQAESAARIVRDRYEQGLLTITEPLRAETALTSARFDLLAARYESVVAHAELLRATGDLNDVQPFQ